MTPRFTFGSLLKYGVQLGPNMEDPYYPGVGVGPHLVSCVLSL